MYFLYKITIQTIKLNTLPPRDKLIFMVVAETRAGSEAHTNGAGHWSTLYVVLYIGWLVSH